MGLIGAAWQVMIYTSGFPCQPYSLLSTSRKMLADCNSRQLWAVLRNLKDTKPMDSRLKGNCSISFLKDQTNVESCGCKEYNVQQTQFEFGFPPPHQSPIFLCNAQCRAEIGMLENVLGFQAVLATVLAVIQKNFREYLRCS